MIRGAALVGELRVGGGYCRFSCEEWAATLQSMASGAVKRSQRNQELRSDPMQVYGAFTLLRQGLPGGGIIRQTVRRVISA